MPLLQKKPMLIGAALAAFLGSSVLAETSSALKLGALFPLTGSMQAYGETSLNGVKLAVDEINQAGGVLGQPVQIVVGDDQSSPQAGIDSAQKMVSVEKISALLGPMISGVTIPIATTITGKAGIPQITGSSTSPVITNLEDQDFLFRTAPSDVFQGVALAQIAHDKGYKNVSVIYINNDYGIGLAQAFQSAFEKTGGKVSSVTAYAEKQSSYRGEIRKAAQGKPDALVLISYPGDGIPIIKQSIEGGAFQNFLFTDGMKAPEVAKAVGGKYLNGMAGSSPAPLSDSQTAKDFAEAYRAKFGDLPPKPYIDGFYDATYVLALAAEKAKSTDPKAIRDALRFVTNAPGEKVTAKDFAKAKKLLAEGKDIDYVGAAGNHEFDKNGDVSGTFSHWEFQDGQIKTIRSFELNM